MMKRLMIFALLLTGLLAAVSCGKGEKEKEQKADPLYGVWADPHGNYVFILANDTVRYFLDEMDGIEFEVPYQKKDNNTLTFTLEDNGKGTIVLDPTTLDIKMTIDYGEEPETYEIPAADHYNIATTAPHIASTLLYAEDMTTVVDTLRMEHFYPIVGGDENHLTLGLPDGRKGWIDGRNTSLVKGKVSPYFLESNYSQEALNLAGHPDHLDTYSFKQLENGKIGVMFNRMFYTGTPAQEQYYAGELDGIKLKVSHAFTDYNEWEEGHIEAATALDEPFEITLVESLDAPHIKVGKRIFEQRQPEY